MRRYLMALLVAACFGLGLAACDSSDGGSSEIDLGDDDKVASGLSEAEAASLCEEVEKKAAAFVDNESSKHQTCLMAGLFTKAFAGDSVEACQEAYDQCMAAEPGEEVGGDDQPGDEVGGDDQPGDDCGSAHEDLEDCDATLGELEACMNDSQAKQQDAADQVKSLTCSSTSEDAEALQGDSEYEEPASCKALEEKCPGMGVGARETENLKEPPQVDDPPEPDGEPIPGLPE